MTSIDNKIDFKRRTTKKPVTEHKENVAEKASHKDNGPLKRSDEDIVIEYVNTKTLFVNEDNATQYYNNRPIAPRLDDQTADNDENDHLIAPEQRIEIILPQTNNKRYESDFDNNINRPNYDFNSRPNSYYPIYSMTPTQQTQTPTLVRKPVLYQNNRPIYDSAKIPIKATNSPISSPFLSTPFSYDVSPEKVSSSPTLTAESSSNYEHLSVPIFVTSNRYTTRPTQQYPYTRPSSSYYTTRRQDALSTFMFVGTTRRSPLSTIFFSPSSNVRPTSAINYQLSLSTPSSSFSSASHPSSAIYADQATNQLPFFISNTNKISTINRPATSSVVSNLPSVFSSDKIDTNEFDQKFDGYLRPDTSFYVPNSGNRKKPAYMDFKNLTPRPETSTTKKNDLKFVYLENVLHKYYQKKESEISLSDRSKSDIKIDSSSSLPTADEDTTIASVDTNNEDRDDDLVKATDEGRSNKRDEILIVPFKLLTRIDRPDNWINTESNGDNPELDERLPLVPDLQQNENVAKELPQPLLGKKTTSPKTTQM